MGARTQQLLAAAAVVAQVVGPVVAPPAAPWAAPGVGLACQAQLNAFCNTASINTDCYNASLAPWFGLFDHNGSPDGQSKFRRSPNSRRGRAVVRMRPLSRCDCVPEHLAPVETFSSGLAFVSASHTASERTHRAAAATQHVHSRVLHTR